MVSIPGVVIGIFLDIFLLTSVSDRNEYQEYSQGGNCGWCIGLITLTPSCANCLAVLEPQTPGTLRPCTGIVIPFNLVKI
jgi:hypothetical protein